MTTNDRTKQIPFFKSTPSLKTAYVIIIKTIVPIIEGTIRVGHIWPGVASATYPTPTIKRYDTIGPNEQAKNNL